MSKVVCSQTSALHRLRDKLEANSTGPRILITRLSHIGDCVLTLPVLSALRRTWSDAFIAWAVESPTQQLLKLHPDLDEIVLVPKGWVRTPKRWGELFRRLRSCHFDVVIDPQGLTKSAGLGWMSGAKTRIGVRGQWGREFSQVLNNRLVKTQSAHVVDRSLELLSALGIAKSPVSYGLPVCPDSERAMDGFLNSRNLNKTFVVINPGASWPSKRWENERFATVASHLHQRYGIRSVISWAGDEEQQMAKQIFNLNPTATVLADQTSLRELAALCQRACFFVGCDTGPMHIAAAMGTPCVGLYGTTRPEESGAYGPQHMAIQKWYQSGNSRQRRGADNDAMRDILASDVNAACDRMLEQLGDSRLAAS